MSYRQQELQYTFEPFSGTTFEDLSVYLQQQLAQLAAVLSILQEKANIIQVITRQPNRPKEGMLVYADGIGWNPGMGRGMYIYVPINGVLTWQFLVGPSTTP